MKLKTIDFIITQDKTKEQVKAEIQEKLNKIDKPDPEMVFVADVFDAKKNIRYKVFTESDKTKFSLDSAIIELGFSANIPSSDSFDTYKTFNYNNTLYKIIKGLVPYLNIENKATSGTPANITSNTIDFDTGVNFISSATSLTGTGLVMSATNHNKPRNLGKSGLIFIESGFENFGSDFIILGDLPEDKNKVLFSYFISPVNSKIYVKFSGNLK